MSFFDEIGSFFSLSLSLSLLYRLCDIIHLETMEHVVLEGEEKTHRRDRRDEKARLSIV